MLTLDLSTFRSFTTMHPLLREPCDTDVFARSSPRSYPRAMRFVAKPLLPRDEAAEELIATRTKDRSENNCITWAITLRYNNTLNGSIGFYPMKKEHYRAKVCSMLHPDHWRQGLKGEALDALVEHGFQVLGIHSTEGITDLENGASHTFLARHGFTKDAHFQEDFSWNGLFLDTLVCVRWANDR